MADINQELQAAASNFNKLNREMSEFINSTFKRLRADSKLLDSAASAQEDLTDAVVDSTKTQKNYNKTAQTTNALKKKETELTKQIIDARKKLATMEANGQRNTVAYEKLRKQIFAADKERSQVRSQMTKNTKMAGASMMSIVGKANILGAAFTWLTNILVGQYKQQFDVMRAYSAVIEDTGGGYQRSLLAASELALSFAVGSKEFAGIVAANRQMINAMGGNTMAFAQVQEAAEKYAVYTGGDFKQALELATNQMTSFARVGVRPTSAAMNTYMKDVQQLAAQTGMSVEAMQEYYNEIATDTSSLVLLRAARESERAAILQSQRAMVQNAIAAGMSADAAKEATKTLLSMVAAKPIDRMKQAAKMRALGGAMGIAGADIAAQAVIAGPRASKEQQEALREFSTNAANMADQMRGAGLGMEIFSTTLLDKLDLEKYFGADSKFTTTLGKTLAKPIAELNKTMTTAFDSTTVNALMVTAKSLEQASLVMSGQNIGGILSKIATNIESIFNWTEKAAEQIWVKLKQGFDAVTNFLDGIGNIIGNIFGGAWSAIKSAFTSSDKASTVEVKPTQADQSRANRVDERAETANKTAAEGVSMFGKQVETSKQTLEATQTVAEKLQTQLTAMTTANEILQKIHENSGKQIELAEKQLAATLATDAEKQQAGIRRGYLEGSKFSNFGYIP